jgi:preprotein translocase subunit SecD
MTRTDQWKLAVVLIVTAMAAWYLFPSYRYYSMTPEQRQALPPQQLAELRTKAIPLGLDLQGGMHLLLEVDRSRLSPAEAADAPDRAMEIIRNRVDQFGVAEPLIQREGENRIAVQFTSKNEVEEGVGIAGSL